jgi:gamma-glutamylcyclotransferase
MVTAVCEDFFHVPGVCAVNYFAYGSNLSLVRLRARTPSANPLGIVSVPGYQLRFHKIGRDGSAKCDACYTGDSGHILWGRVFHIADDEKPALDRAEGLGAGYKLVTLQLESLVPCARAYVATDIDTRLQPFDWYKNHVLVGARESGLPAEYIAKMEQVESRLDPDSNRAKREKSIYV